MSLSTGSAYPLALNGGLIPPPFGRRAGDVCGKCILEFPYGSGIILGSVVRNWKTGIIESDKRESWITGQELQWSPNGRFLDEGFVLLDVCTVDRFPTRKLRGAMSLFIMPTSPDDTRSYRFLLPDFLQGDVHWSERAIPDSDGRATLPQGYSTPTSKIA
ncbi:hypothetical protein BV25DRAFT_1529334 [Artomyces pyxidatus]|uniref:Uncharacterized protein n=1 Tax=Artomyces pyxidatus TaxID=48021 RepID=A0ACB8TCL5_9AGAM|nr:hypothetical protein BV25DRAFT_1529334 [Artomyces pyxidatus]